ncbi:hypothetical protein FSP39_008446 [Pinctada imbricata]|uniref:DNA 3'-5' helicase n=1 Tax=Pinctada imbricata TaxID=66713 RepID=A0AA88YVW3_PINIB|nr:hypothetical protein FSP39_008446 [Pinctada imbricata]
MAACSYDFDCVRKTFNLPVLQDFQKETLTALLNKRDAFVSVRTGGGKSICYQGFVTAFGDRHREEPCSVLVVSPLISIMKEQCKYLENIGFSSAYIGCDSGKDEAIFANSIQFVFTSPESLCGSDKWRGWLTNNTTIRLIAVDEAHTVLHW